MYNHIHAEVKLVANLYVTPWTIRR